MRIAFILLFFLLPLGLFGQVEDAWVFFSDKENVNESLEDPLSILTQEALDRKALHNIPIDERDVPVNEDYIDQLKQAQGITVLAKSKWMNCVYVQGTQQDIESLFDLSFVSGVEYADKNLNLMPVGPKEDKFFLERPTGRMVFDYGAATNQVEMIAADFLHQQDLTGEGMIIAVLDSGFPNVAGISAFSHLIESNRLLGTYDFVGRQTNVTGTGSHGTRTMSDMAGLLDGQFVGTAPGASYYLFRTEFAPTEVPVEEAYWVEALERADSLGVDVVNTSLGYQDYDDPNYDHAYEDLDGQTTFAARGGNIAFEKGMLLVTSAGNDGGGFTFVGTPADAPGVFTVGAVTPSGNFASFSSIGPTVDGRIKPDIMAQGVEAAVINAEGNVSFNNGTSFSSPIAAGAITSLWQLRPETTNAELMQLIREASDRFDDPTDEMGYGIPDFEAAYQALQTLSVQDVLRAERFGIAPNPADSYITVSLPVGVESASLSIYNVLGERIVEFDQVGEQSQVDVSALQAGLYLCAFEAGGVRQTLKLIRR